ncbi:MAG: nickel pincer cofactor biosynthesis protein LarC [Phycisphaerales bacterium]|nr:nickel pincer cofactor biosynthesis protein LarC [Phycisphaerales bacterium]
MRIGYFDCFSGASGDMILAACLDAGLALDTLRADLAGLGLEGYQLEAQKVRKQGFAATRFEVQLAATEQPHRHLKDIRRIIESARLAPEVQERSLAVFTRLAEAEAAVHGTTVEKVHFHEVGAIDAIVDIVGACLALRRMGIDQVFCSPIPTGSGTVQCDHGLMPVPAPATAALLKGIPLAACDETGELTTPTGAAILTTLAAGFGPPPAMSLEKIGVGAGRRDGQRRPNILRLLIGSSAVDAAITDEEDEIIVLESNLDDMTAEVIGYVYDRLFAEGALDVFTSPIYMKKNRPAVQLTVLAPMNLREALETVILSETTTFGVRGYPARRRKLVREFETVQTDFGPIRIKVGRQGGRVVTAAAEFDDCRQAAERTGRPLRELMEQALCCWRENSR